MPRGGTLIRIERRETDWLGLSLFTAAGLGLGLLLGMTASQLVGSVDTERIAGRLRRRPETDEAPPAEDPAAVERLVSGALGEHPTTRQLDVTVRALGNGIVELTGFAPDAEARRLAGTVARGVAGAGVVVNRILVEDEDVPRRPPAPATEG